MLAPSQRRSDLACAVGSVRANPSTWDAVFDNKLAKGNVLEVARLAGIMAVKKTPDLIPTMPPGFRRRPCESNSIDRLRN